MTTGSSASDRAWPGERAREVFDHPYGPAARHGVPTTARAA